MSTFSNGLVAALRNAGVKDKDLPFCTRLVMEYRLDLSSLSSVNKALEKHGLPRRMLNDVISASKISAYCTGLVLWTHLLATGESAASLKKKATSLKLDKEDVSVIRALGLKLPDDSDSGKFMKVTPKSFAALVGKVCQDIRPWLRRFVYVKLRFVYQSEGMAREDMESELLVHGIRALNTSCIKLLSPLHALNVAKTAIHNYGISLIQKVTRPSRQRIRASADGFEATVLPLTDALTASMVEPTIDNVESDYAVTSAARKMLQVKNPKKRKFLYLLGGFGACPEFDAFLNRNNKEPEKFDVLAIPTQVRLITAFLGVPYTAGVRYLKRLASTHENPF